MGTVMASTKMEKLVIELMRESTNILEHASQSEEALEIATQGLQKALDTLHCTNYEERGLA